MSNSQLVFVADTMNCIRREKQRLYRPPIQPAELQRTKYHGGATPERVVRYPF